MYNYNFVRFDTVSIDKQEGKLQYKFVLPGVDRNDITISITNNKLTVQTKQQAFFGQKFKYVDTYNYDANYKVQDAKAKLSNGILTITIPQKKVKEKSKQITIE